MNGQILLGLLAGALLALFPLLILLGLRKGGARGRPAAGDLASTHEQIRRYTADLEKTHAEKEKRLSEITLLHDFGMRVHRERQADTVYVLVLKFIAQVSEARWIFLCHRREKEGRVAMRTFGDPPAAAQEWARHEACAGAEAGDRVLAEADPPGLGPCRGHLFVRDGEGGRVALLLLFPRGEGSLGEDQLQVAALVMNRAESQLSLVALTEEVERANRRLLEGNTQLRRLIELENEFSRAFLERREVSETFQTLHEIMTREIFEMDRINLFLPDAAGEMLEAATSVGIGDYPLEKVKVPLDERGGALSLAFREGRSISFDGRGPVPPQYRLAEPFASIPPIRSRIFLIVPVVDHRGKVMGILAADRKYSHQPITPETAMMLEAFARHTALLFSLRSQESGCGGG